MNPLIDGAKVPRNGRAEGIVVADAGWLKAQGASPAELMHEVEDEPSRRWLYSGFILSNACY
jgi:hypothetical protein